MLTYFKCYIYLDVLMYVPIVYGFLPEINVFVLRECHVFQVTIHEVSFHSLPHLLCILLDIGGNDSVSEKCRTSKSKW